MRSYHVMNHKSRVVKKAHNERLNEIKSARYQRLLQEGVKVSPLETQLARFKKD
ncbi:hypothetical protein [Romboutsia ilealis]|uniref:hypothetical protein n=1 Tax=Romboutsia ilealis TaxID=1115758 RepID=UPI00272B5DB5|nr:hypothetical protein [Romboutsia ilealis]